MSFLTPPILDGATLPGPLLRRVHGAAAALRERGAVPGSRVAIGSTSAPDVLGWVLGADLLGAAALVVSPAWTDRERDAVLSDARPDVLVDGPSPPPGEPVAPQPGDDALFYLPTTSGSSGRPKVLARTRRSWRLGFAALGPVPGPVLIPGPLASSLFLFGALHALHHGVPVRFRARVDPVDAAEAGTVHLVPAMLPALLDPAAAPRTIICGGAHVGAALRERCGRLLPGTELVEYYGSAEHSLIALRRGGGPLRPVPGVDVRVRGGELVIRTPQAFAGYLRGGRLDPAGDGHLGVGDRGEVGVDGDLVVHGRDSATISSGGSLVAAEEVEDVLRAVPGVVDVVVAGTPHERLGQLVTAVLEAPDVAPPLRDLRAAARAGLAPGKRPRRWLVAAELPRLASGKVARAAVAAGLGDGTLAANPIRSDGVADPLPMATRPTGVAAPAPGSPAATHPRHERTARSFGVGGPRPGTTGDPVRNAAGSGADRDTGRPGDPAGAPIVIDNSVRNAAGSGLDPGVATDDGRADG